MKKLFITCITLLSFGLNLFSLDFKVASYNLENLFDLEQNNTEYEEYIPNKTNWNSQTLEVKLTNISKVINDLDADIIGLQEIESQEALQLLLNKTPLYKYSAFIKNPNSAIGIGLLSKFEITDYTAIGIDVKNTYSRPILKATVKIENHMLDIYVNHWRSKSAAESSRIPYARALYNYISQQPNTNPYIILGDFNANYDENQTFKYDKKLNNTQGITAINDILKTSLNGEFITKYNIHQIQGIVHYNLWLELPYHQRYSYKFKGTPNTPDSIIVSKQLLNSSNISYINNSFGVFKPEYLYKRGYIQRWEIDKKGYHKKRGYSDHLPIFALFSTSTIHNYMIQTQNPILNISDLYTIESINQPLTLHNATVIYKIGNSAIIKQENDRAIFVYNQAKNLKLGTTYDITTDKIGRFYGQLQITSILNAIETSTQQNNLQNLFLESNKLDLFDLSLQNEVVKNLEAQYIKRDLHYNNTKIKLYAKNKDILPPQNAIIKIKSGHLSIYNNIPQIVIYSKDDYEILQ